MTDESNGLSVISFGLIIKYLMVKASEITDILLSYLKSVISISSIIPIHKLLSYFILL